MQPLHYVVEVHKPLKIGHAEVFVWLHCCTTLCLRPPCTVFKSLYLFPEMLEWLIVSSLLQFGLCLSVLNPPSEAGKTCTHVSGLNSTHFCGIYDPFNMDHFKVGWTLAQPTLHLSHVPANCVETSLDNWVRPSSIVVQGQCVSAEKCYKDIVNRLWVSGAGVESDKQHILKMPDSYASSIVTVSAEVLPFVF